MSPLDLRVTGCRLSLISTYHPFHGNRAVAGAFQIIMASLATTFSRLCPQGRFWPAGCELFLPSQRVVLESPCFLPSLCPLDWRLEQPRWLQREGSSVFRGWICFASKCNLLLDCYRRGSYISVLFKALWFARSLSLSLSLSCSYAHSSLYSKLSYMLTSI